MNKRKDEEPEQRHSTDQEGKKQQPKRKLGKNLDKKEKKKRYPNLRKGAQLHQSSRKCSKILLRLFYTTRMATLKREIILHIDKDT